jgi:hypothetical protein
MTGTDSTEKLPVDFQKNGLRAVFERATTRVAPATKIT